MTDNHIEQIINILLSNFPNGYKNRNLEELGGYIAYNFGDVTGESFIQVLNTKVRESRNTPDLHEIHRRAKLVDSFLVDNYHHKLKDYNDHLSQSVEDYNTQPSLFSLFGDPEPRKTYEETRELLRAELNKAISGLPDEFRQANGIKEA